MGGKPRRAYKVGDVVAVKVEIGRYSMNTPIGEDWIHEGYRTLYQPIVEIRKHGDVPHRGEPNERFALDCSSCEEIQPRLSWRSQREFKLAIPVERTL